MTVRTLYYRTMTPEADGFPCLGRSRRRLGVKTDGKDPDVEVQTGNMVVPGKGGMSVYVNSPRKMPYHRLPVEWGGSQRKDLLFRLSGESLPDHLHARPVALPHAEIEPRRRMDLEEYEAALAGTRTLWKVASPPKANGGQP
jgi:hypothetical protein